MTFVWLLICQFWVWCCFDLLICFILFFTIYVPRAVLEVIYPVIYKWTNKAFSTKIIRVSSELVYILRTKLLYYSNNNASRLIPYYLIWCAEAVEDLRVFRGGDFGNRTRTAGVWAYGRILCICELGRAGVDTGRVRGEWLDQNRYYVNKTSKQDD